MNTKLVALLDSPGNRLPRSVHGLGPGRRSHHAHADRPQKGGCTLPAGGGENALSSKGRQLDAVHLRFD